MKSWKIGLALLPLLFVVGSLYANNGDTVNQGFPGKTGPWPVTMAGSGSVNDAGALLVTEPMLTKLVPTTVQVGTVATAVPAVAVANRTSVEICNTSENGSGIIIKCIVDDADAGPPVLGPSNPGTALVVGQCLTAKAPASMTPFCISNTAAVDGSGGAFASVSESVQ